MAGPVRHPPRQETKSRRGSPANMDSPAMMPTLPQSIPRPPNAWILYRSDRLKAMAPLPEGQKRAQSAVSKQLSQDWANETQEVRDKYERMADQRKAEHHVMYPNYRFTPMKKEEKAALREAKKKAREEAKKLRGRARGRRAASSQHHPPPQPSPLHQSTCAGVPYFPAELFGAAGPSPPISAASSPEPVPESSESPSDLSKPSTPDISSSAPILALPHPLVAAPQGPPSANPYVAYFRSGGTDLVYTQPDAVSTAAAARAPVDYQQQQPLANEAQSLQIPTESIEGESLGYGPSDWMQAMPQQVDALSFDVDPSMFAMDPNFDPTLGLGDFGQFNDGVFELGMFDPSMLGAALPSNELTISFDSFASAQSSEDYYSSLPALPQESVLSDPAAANEAQHQLNLASASLPVPQQYAAPTPDPNQFNYPINLPIPQDTPTSTSSLSPALSVDLSNVQENTQKTSYVPPSGAAMSSTRRVGGRWKPPIEPPHDGSSNNNSYYRVRAS